MSASPSATTDGENVYSFFQEIGLISYGPDGNERWRVPLGPFNNPFGMGSSPVLAGDRIIQVLDGETDSFMIAVDKDTGKTIWRVERPEAIDQLRPEGVDIPLVLELRQAPVEPQPHRQIGDVVLRDQHRGPDRDVRRPGRLGRLRAGARTGGADRLFQHLLVELDADLADMAGLLGPKQVAGAPNVEVVAGEREAGAERIEPVDHVEPL